MQSLNRNSPKRRAKPHKNDAAKEKMDKRIVGFHGDAEGHWVAELECGHAQHVRHLPPWTNREWVTTVEGRMSRIGQMLNCKKCDE
jgi:hypothetical protein